MAGLSPTLQALVSKSEGKYKRGSSDIEKIPEGRSQWRIIAPRPGEVPWVGADEQFWVDVGVFWIKADENGKPLAVVGDSDVCYNTPSPVGAAIEAAIAGAMDEESEALYKSWRSRKTVLVNAISRTKGEVVKLEMTATTFGKLLALASTYNAGDNPINIFDHQTGMDIIVTRSGKGLQTTYDIVPAPTSKPVTKEQIASCFDLKAFVAQQYFRNEETKAVAAISQISGVPMPASISSYSPPVAHLGVTSKTPALASEARAVEDAKVETKPAGPTPEQIAMEERRKELLRKQAEAAAELAALETPKEAAAPAETTTGVDLSDAEADALLADLDALVNDTK